MPAKLKAPTLYLIIPPPVELLSKQKKLIWKLTIAFVSLALNEESCVVTIKSC